MSNLELDWVQKARQGDEEAFSLLVEKYQSPVYNLCYRMLGTEVEAEDAAQEAFWRAYQNLVKFDPQRSFITWLLSIAAHYCIDETRKRRYNTIELDALPEDTIPDFGPNPESEASRSEEQERMRALLKNLNPQDRAAIVLRYWYDFSEEEIANSLSLTVSAVKSRLHRSRLALAQAYSNLQPATINTKERMRHESHAF